MGNFDFRGIHIDLIPSVLIPILFQAITTKNE